jgi:hypothetical protein
MNVKEFMDWLSNYPPETPVTVYVDGSIGPEAQWLVHEENLEFETGPDNGGKLPVPQVSISLSADESLL